MDLGTERLGMTPQEADRALHPEYFARPAGTTLIPAEYLPVIAGGIALVVLGTLAGRFRKRRTPLSFSPLKRGERGRGRRTDR